MCKDEEKQSRLSKETENEQKLSSAVEIATRRLKLDNSNQVSLTSNITINILRKVKILKIKLKKKGKKDKPKEFHVNLCRLKLI